MKVKCPECGHRFDHDLLEFDPEDPEMKAIGERMDECDKKFKAENPCPKCGSHNVDIDLGTPIFCKDCGYDGIKLKLGIFTKSILLGMSMVFMMGILPVIFPNSITTMPQFMSYVIDSIIVGILSAVVGFFIMVLPRTNWS
jgi:DNA-directed RNA polymerase subunit RPC12/RpoP